MKFEKGYNIGGILMTFNLLLFIGTGILILIVSALLKFSRRQFSSGLLYVFLEEESRSQLRVENLNNTKYHKVKTLLVGQALTIVVVFVVCSYLFINNPDENGLKLSFVLLLLFNRYLWNHYIKKNLT